MCLPGALARYMQLRQFTKPVPLGPEDTLARFKAWALEPLFQTHISTQAKVQDTAYRPFMETDNDVQRTARHLEKLYKTAGIKNTPYFLTRRLRQGGANAALLQGLPSELVSKRMGHNSNDKHVKNYTGQITDPVPAMAAVAGHAGRHIQLGRTAVSARRSELFRPLYDAVSNFPDGAGERLHGWLASLEKPEPLANAFKQMWKVLEHLPDVLLQDLAALQDSQDGQVKAFHAGLKAQAA